jgi:hypothetical protein
VQVHFLILDALPQPRDKDVIAPGAFAVHADLDTVRLHLVDALAGSKNVISL